MIDPVETQANAVSAGKRTGDKEPWNGEYYVSYGFRSWSDAVKYGFISAGGGSWYSQTLKMLKTNDRIWVNIPKTGYVGVGIVTNEYQPMREVFFDTDEGKKSAFEVLSAGADYKARDSDDTNAEYVVRVKWLDTVPESKAFNAAGLFGNQNTVCRPSTPSWRHTIERLKSFFKKWDTQKG